MKTLTRSTKETQITASLEVYGSGVAKISTGVGFFDHMLESLTKHSLMDLTLECRGDLAVDSHHSVEDCGIVLGQLLAQSIYPVKNIERFGFASIVMDEARAECSLDLANRAFFVFDVPKKKLKGKIGAFDAELVEEFFRALVFNANLTAHIVFKRGHNAHHIAESTFKAFAIALRSALKPNERVQTPSTKGVL